MAVPGPADAPEAGGGDLAQRLVVLMGARLALSLVSLAIALGLDAAGEELAIVHRRGFYGTVALAFLATGIYGLMLRRIRRPKSFAAVHIATDIVFVSALVHFSGGAHSAFTFLYALVAVYGAILFERSGALVSAGVGALAYGGVLSAAHWGWFLGPAEGASEPVTVLFTQWAVHAGAILLVAGLSSYLAAELRRTGQALHERTSDLERLRALHQRTVESLVSGLLSVDLQGRVTSFNPEAERITGIGAADAMRRDIEQVLPGARARVLAHARADGGPAARTRMPFRNAAGGSLHLGVAGYILWEDDATPSGHVVIFQDVTQVVAMEDELRRSERLAAVGELSARIAHEIRNPLAAISGSIQILETKLRSRGPEPESRRLMDIVLRETDRLNQLIGDFLLYARPGPLHLEPVCVSEAVGEILKMFDATRPRGLELGVDVEPDLAVRADPDRLRQVLWNLIRNAVEAMPEGGLLRVAGSRLVEVSAQEAPGDRRNGDREKCEWVEIAVIDQGEGVPTDVRDRIFDPFFTTKRDGTGLGLPTVHRIVQDHGGSLRLESTPGVGTAVRLRLPRAEWTG